jgi:hypothetical protein
MGPFVRASRFGKAQFLRTEKTVGVLLVATRVAFLTGGFQRAMAAEALAPKLLPIVLADSLRPPYPGARRGCS